MSAQKMGFWAVFSFVVSSQIGSGVFLFPNTLAPFGTSGLFAWGLAGIGALSLALMFAGLCRRFPFTGGPHVYIVKVFGAKAGFYVAWVYWVVAWLSSAPVLATIASAFCTLLGLNPSLLNVFVLQVLTLMLLMLINLRGVEVSGLWEIVLSLIKIFPLVLFPLAGLFFLEKDFFTPLNPSSMPWYSVLNQAALAMLWGFLGVEAITTTAGSVHKPETTLPKALAWGTLVVLAVYVLNTVSVMGLVPPQILNVVPMPYSVALGKLLPNLGEKLMAFFIVVVCVAAMNAWILAMGQVAKGAAEDGLFPEFFARVNAQGAPFWGIIISCVCLFFSLLALSSQDLVAQIRLIIDLSVISSIGIYALCAWAFWRVLKQKEVGQKFIASISLLFCAWILWGASLKLVVFSLCFPLSGLPFYYLWTYRKPMGSSSL